MDARRTTGAHVDVTAEREQKILFHLVIGVEEDDLLDLSALHAWTL